MPPKVSMIGRRFERLMVIQESPERPSLHEFQWICRCDCGSEVKVRGTNLRTGNTTSCGCRRQEVSTQRALHHGAARRGRMLPEYISWVEMRKRCSNRNLPAFVDYGGRGIKVCPEWDSFEQFYADMGARPSPKHSLDRINNNGPYSPENCRWATRTDQNRNTRATRFLTHQGQTLPIGDWADKTGIGLKTIHGRMRRGWSVCRTLECHDCVQDS
jgi:hypothetical protein